MKWVGSLPEGDGEQMNPYWISASQTVPTSQRFFFLPCPKMALNAGAWRDLKDHQVCGSQMLACAKGCDYNPRRVGSTEQALLGRIGGGGGGVVTYNVDSN